MNVERKFSWQHAIALLLAVAITQLVFRFQNQIREYAGLTYFGAFLAMLVGNATIILPAPALVVVYALGSQLNPLLLGLCAGMGGALGELTGYLAGYSGSGIVSQSKLYARVQSAVEKYGLLVLFVLAAVPNPFFDLAGMVAGSLRIPARSFFLVVLAGIILKSALVAIAGFYSIQFFNDYFLS